MGMMMAETTVRREELLGIAERMIRTVGYNGFSTRDVAVAAGIKAASVHYHFPTKADIGTAVTLRYTDKFLKALGDPARFIDAPAKGIATFVAAFRHSLVSDRQLCLCAVLGAETGGLPNEVQDATRVFFQRNLEWLIQALAHHPAPCGGTPETHATLILASLEGAMILAMTLGTDEVFERVVSALI